MYLQTRIVSSLEKVFCSDRLDAESIDRLTLLRGEVGSFQIACRCEERCEVSCTIRGRGNAPVFTVRHVESVPSFLPAMPDDPFILTSEPGLFPDPLIPGNRLTMVRGKWNAFWVTVAVPPDAVPGSYEVEISLVCAATPTPWPSPPFAQYSVF